MDPSAETVRKVAATVAAGTITVCGDSWTELPAVVVDEVPSVVVVVEVPLTAEAERTSDRLSAMPSLSLPLKRCMTSWTKTA